MNDRLPMSDWHPGNGPDSPDIDAVDVWRLSFRPPFNPSQRGDCRRFLLRLLGRCLGIASADVALVTGTFGKPGLDPSLNPRDIQFNVSHSGRIALIALARGRRVGVDVQRCVHLASVDALLRRFFSAEARAFLEPLGAGEKERAFAAFWSRNEAGMKALGGSIARTARVPINPAPPSRNETGAGTQWQCVDLPIDDGYAAALCYEGLPAEVRLWTGDQAPGSDPGLAAERDRE